MAYDRQTAIAVSASDILSGRYVVKEGWTPNFIETGRGPISRASVIGAIIQELEPGVWILDDGTGQIQLRTFDTKKPYVAIGDVVQVIGRPREYGNNRYVNYEIIKKIPQGWLQYRKRELELIDSTTIVQKNEIEERGEEVVVQADGNLFEKVLDIIRKEDAGAGADMDAVLKLAASDKAEHVLKSLMEEGEVFEIKPGKIKVLE